MSYRLMPWMDGEWRGRANGSWSVGALVWCNYLDAASVMLPCEDSGLFS